MHSIKRTLSILTSLLVVVVLLAPIHFTEQNKGDSAEGGVAHNEVALSMGVGLSVVEAKCGRSCKLRRKIRKIWSNFLGTAGASVGPPSPFGGNINAIVICNGNAKIAFTQTPVAGIGGPYGVMPASGNLYAYYSVAPSRWEVGTAPAPNVCVVCLSWVCLEFEVQEVSNPGMGTS